MSANTPIGDPPTDTDGQRFELPTQPYAMADTMVCHRLLFRPPTPDVAVLILGERITRVICPHMHDRRCHVDDTGPQDCYIWENGK